MYKDTKRNRCAICGLQTHRRCSRCLDIYYCNQDHQRQDWRRHKTECLPKLTEEPSEENSTRSSESEEIIKKSVLIDRISEQTVVTQHHSVSTGAAEQTISKKKKKSKKKRAKKEAVVAGSSEKIFETDSSEKKDSIIDSDVKSSLVNPSSESDNQSAITEQGSSEQEILSEPTQQLSAMNYNMGSTQVLKVTNRINVNVPVTSSCGERQRQKQYQEGVLRSNPQYPLPTLDARDYEVCRTFIHEMNEYGVCLLRNFYGKERGMLVRNEVLDMYKSGIFTAGELVSNPDSSKTQSIRSDLTTWIDGTEPYCRNISQLMSYIDRIVITANKMAGNGKMGDYDIKGRTKAMVACYPGSGSHYVQHIDNPHKDGRCITAIFYLNVDWDVKKAGGLLRVFPEGSDIVCNVEPLFDHMLFFWSDRRNPHEVQAAYDTRYAITLWYFDSKERAEALKRYNQKNQPSTSK